MGHLARDQETFFNLSSRTICKFGILVKRPFGALVSVLGPSPRKSYQISSKIDEGNIKKYDELIP